MKHATGDCFEVALKLTLDSDQDLLVVHGLPVGQGPENLGQRYWHAWVEDADGVIVLDFANGHDFQLPRALYYGVGQLDEEHVWRFTATEARAEVLLREHYGPWVDGWETMSDL